MNGSTVEGRDSEPSALPNTTWPLVPVSCPSLKATELTQVKHIADKLAESRPIRHAQAYTAMCAQEDVHLGWLSGGPTLWAEDHRGIELVSEVVAQGYEYRSLGLCETGDTFLISRPRDPTFENYVRCCLELGAPDIQSVTLDSAHPHSLFQACLEEPGALNALVDKAQQAGGMSIAPFRSSGYTWQLARTLAGKAKVPVFVAAPTPPLARAANDKLWFADVTRALLGSEALPPASRVYSAAAAAKQLSQLANKHKRLVLKTPSSAGANGNIVLESAALRGRSLIDIHTLIVNALATLGDTGYKHWPLMLGVWEENVLASPSLQSWIPRPADGEPVIEGIYEQQLIGTSGIFVGAREAMLSEQMRYQFEREGLQLALLLQRVGYVGRASFDALFIQSTGSTAPGLHWIECNARWGGVSIPMSELRRLGIGAGERCTVIAQIPLDATRTSFQSVLDASTEFSYERDSRTGIVWLTPPDTGRRGLSFIAVERTARAADTLARDLTTQLSELNSA